MTLTPAKLKDFIFYLALFSLISLWNIPHTIAARYACGGLLIVLVLSSSLDCKPILRKSKLIILFFAYLLIQLFFFSTDLKSGLSGFKSEWMYFILFTIIGIGSGLYASKANIRNPLFLMGTAFSIPLLIHLRLTLHKGIELGAIPWRFWGISEIHGDLAYASLQASILLAVFFINGAKTRLQCTLVILFLLACIASPLIAESRGGLIFALGSIFLTLSCYLYFKPSTTSSRSRIILNLVVILVFLSLILKVSMAVNPERWDGSISRSIAGLKGDANEVLCNGIEFLRIDYQSKGIPITTKIESEFIDVTSGGDGSRIIVARSGLHLMLEHPMGINGSKQAYQIAINQFCGKVPTIALAHTHNGWIDTALAIGTPGAILLLLVMLNYGWQGFKMIGRSKQINPFALALFISAGVWILRGMLDSTLRDQMLEMQAFILAFLLASAISYQPKTLGAK